MKFVHKLIVSTTQASAPESNLIALRTWDIEPWRRMHYCYSELILHCFPCVVIPGTYVMNDVGRAAR